MLKRMLEIQKRKAELTAQIGSLSGADLDNAIAEVDKLQEEEKELRSKMTEVEKRANFIKVDKGVEVKDEYTVESPEYRTAYLKDLQGKKLTEVEKRAMTSAAGSAGAVIPTTTMNKVIEKLYGEGVLFPLVTNLNIPGNVTLPVEDTTADMAWVAEDTASSDSNDKVGKVELLAYKLIKTIEVSANVEAMSIDAFETFLVNTLARKVKVALDAAIANGDGSSKAQGICNKIAGIQTAAADTLDYDDICDLLASVKAAYKQGAVFAMSTNTLYKRVAKVKDTTKMPIFKQEAKERFAGNVMGYPVVVCDYIPDDKIIFGNFSYYYMNIAKAFEIAKDNSVGFRKGSTVYRAMGLADGKVALQEAFNVLTVQAGG